MPRDDVFRIIWDWMGSTSGRSFLTTLPSLILLILFLLLSIEQFVDIVDLVNNATKVNDLIKQNKKDKKPFVDLVNDSPRVSELAKNDNKDNKEILQRRILCFEGKQDESCASLKDCKKSKIIISETNITITRVIKTLFSVYLENICVCTYVLLSVSPNSSTNNSISSINNETHPGKKSFKSFKVL